MHDSYKAVLDGDRVRWNGAAPKATGPIEVVVTLLGAGRGRANVAAMLAVADRVSAAGGLGIDDPVAWQREVRQDRVLPGRE
jgi:hypothetical protein